MKAIRTQVADFFADKRIALLGFGKEGQSSLALIRSFHPRLPIKIFDERAILTKGVKLDRYTSFKGGTKFKSLKAKDFDLILCSPGIPPSKISSSFLKSKILFGQAELFLKWYGWQTIGITGTKGKSTTTSLTHHILKKSGVKVFLGGNIGVPLFDLIPKLSQKSYVVAELSCHQLNRSKASPSIAILLNLFEEHLDYYKTVNAYFETKLSIFKFQNEGDALIYNIDDPKIRKYLKATKGQQRKITYSCNSSKADIFIKNSKLSTELLRGKDFVPKTNLIGKVNEYNIMPAIAVAGLLKINKTEIKKHLASFVPLPHRLQYLGEVNNIHFVNDSISTIPEATIAALKALENVGCLFLGGNDRGISYDSLIAFLSKQKIPNLIFFDKAGKRMYTKFKKKYPRRIAKINHLVTDDFTEAVKFCINQTPADSYCLLSPAASSYGIFRNFEDRGEQFEKLILAVSKSKKFKK